MSLGFTAAFNLIFHITPNLLKLFLKNFKFKWFQETAVLSQ